MPPKYPPDKSKPFHQGDKIYEYLETDTITIRNKIWNRDIWLCVSDQSATRHYKRDKRLMFYEPTQEYAGSG